MKYKTAYSVETGYISYDKASDYDSGKSLKAKTGDQVISMTFEGAATLAAGATILLGMMF